MLEKIVTYGKLLGKTKWAALTAVGVLNFAALTLILIGIIKFFHIISQLYTDTVSGNELNTLLFSVNFIIIIEIYLQAMIFYILAIGIYKLFVGEFTLLSWYHIDSLDEMKAELAKAIIIFLSVFLLQKIVEWSDPTHLLYAGIVVALIISNLIWYMNSLKNNKKNNLNHESNKHMD